MTKAKSKFRKYRNTCKNHHENSGQSYSQHCNLKMAVEKQKKKLPASKLSTWDDLYRHQF